MAKDAPYGIVMLSYMQDRQCTGAFIKPKIRGGSSEVSEKTGQNLGDRPSCPDSP